MFPGEAAAKYYEHLRMLLNKLQDKMTYVSNAKALIGKRDTEIQECEMRISLEIKEFALKLITEVIIHPTLYTLHLYTLHPTPYTLTAYTLHPTPYTLTPLHSTPLQPTPLQPTPYTLHLTPYTLTAYTLTAYTLTAYTLHP